MEKKPETSTEIVPRHFQTVQSNEQINVSGLGGEITNTTTAPINKRSNNTEIIIVVQGGREKWKQGNCFTSGIVGKKSVGWERRCAWS